MGATVMMAGVVLLVIGGAGMFGTGNAGHSRTQAVSPWVFRGQLVVGTILLIVGIVLALR